MKFNQEHVSTDEKKYLINNFTQMKSTMTNWSKMFLNISSRLSRRHSEKTVIANEKKKNQSSLN